MWLRRRLYVLLRRLQGELAEITADAQPANPESSARALNRAKPRLLGLLRQSFGDTVGAKALALKLLNLCLARRHFLARDTVLRSLPPGLVVDPSNACNLACPGCVHSERAQGLRLFDWKPGLLSERCFAAFLRRYGPSAIQATLCNYGEPLINPGTPQLIHAAKRYLLHTSLSTNLALPRFDAPAYVESGLDYMLLSIDGATEDVYQRFRRKGDLDQVFHNIRQLVAARGRLNRRTPVLAWRFLAFEHNVHQIPAAIEKARELGIDQFRADPAWDIAWDNPSIRPAPIQSVRVDFRPGLFDALAGNWNPFPDLLDRDSIERDFEHPFTASPAPSRMPAQGPTCEWLYKSITMDANARIFPCCCAPTPKKDLHFATFDLSACDHSFNSEKHQAARAFFASTPLRTGAAPYCLRCDWDKAADPSPEQIRHYFRAAAPSLFSNRALDLLEW